MCNKLKNFKKARYSSLLNLSVKNSVLRIQGPLGTNYVKIPAVLQVKVIEPKNYFYVGLGFCRDRKKSLARLNSFFSIVNDSCRHTVFGSIFFLELDGLGFKFTSVDSSNACKSVIGMNLGYSNEIFYCVHSKRLKVVGQDPRKLLFYSADFPYLKNEIHSIANMKKPDRYKKKGFFLSGL